MDAAWFDTARFGMFIHWGHASQRGWELSWPLVGGVGSLPGARDVGVAEYHAGATTFNPRPGAARAWAELAKAAGMRYAVLTTKHHDGFALWPTAQGDWSIARTPYRGDLVREYVHAFREAGLRIGFYFSLIDWHHPDYPAFSESDKPYRFGRWRQPSPEQWQRYHAFMAAQLRELLTWYGPIDLLWFDGGWERSAAQWRTPELEALIRGLQPGILLNDRLPGAGDYDTPEQAVPPAPPPGRWETCLTMDGSWGYNPSDRQRKSPTSLVHTLCETAGKGGNLLLNVSPDEHGELPGWQVERLEAFARWMQPHAEAIHGTVAGLDPWQFYGPTTRRGDRLYLHLLARPYESVSLRGVPLRKVQSVSLLGGPPLACEQRLSATDALFSPDPRGELVISIPEQLLDPVASVLAVDFEPGTF